MNIVVSTERHAEFGASLFVWDFARKRPIGRMKDSDHNSYGVCVSPDQSRLVVSLGTNCARLFILSPMTRIGLETRDKEVPCRAVAFSPDSRHVLMTNGPKVIVWVFDESQRGPKGEFGGSSGSNVNCMTFSPDGRYVLTGHDDGVVRVWQFDTHRQIGEHKGHQGAVRALSIAPDAPTAASAGADGLIRVWDLEKGPVFRVLKGHEGNVTDVAFLPGGRQIVSTGVDGTVRRWDLDARKTPPTVERPEIPAPVVKQGEIPVSSREELAETKSLIREVFKEEYAEAKRSPQKIELATKLLAHAEDADTEIERYALLTEVGRLGLEAGDPATALQAAYDLAERYAVDGVRLKVSTIEKLARAVHTVEDRDALARQSLVIAEEAALQRRYDLAAVAARVAEKAAAGARDSDLRRLAKKWVQRAERDLSAWDAFRRAEKTLQTDPDDAAANLAAGKYFCTHGGDWQRGLKHLAKGSDDDLKAAAKADLSQPATVDAQVKLAEDWHNAAKQADAHERRAFLSRAVHWYRKALPNATSLKQLRIRKALEELEATLKVDAGT